ncbi:MAG: NAD-dependent deacetylase [Planctomycetaceae bacterium]
MKHPCEVVADVLRERGNAVVFTGAGISTESGIPDFRSPGGVWSRTTPVYFNEFCSSEKARREYWAQKAESHDSMFHARPNVGHRILAGWESRGLVSGLITQNIDGLHQSAGCSKVLELHGTAREVACLDCGERFDAEPWVRQFQATDEIPCCPSCSGMLKHATISIGQPLDPAVINEAVNWSRSCALFIAIGSSLVVTPAADLPLLAVDNGAKLVIINREPTLHDAAADTVVHGEIGPTLERIEALLQS